MNKKLSITIDDRIAFDSHACIVREGAELDHKGFRAGRGCVWQGRVAWAPRSGMRARSGGRGPQEAGASGHGDLENGKVGVMVSTASAAAGVAWLKEQPKFAALVSAVVVACLLVLAVHRAPATKIEDPSQQLQGMMFIDKNLDPAAGISAEGNNYNVDNYNVISDDSYENGHVSSSLGLKDDSGSSEEDSGQESKSSGLSFASPSSLLGSSILKFRASMISRIESNKESQDADADDLGEDSMSDEDQGEIEEGSEEGRLFTDDGLLRGADDGYTGPKADSITIVHLGDGMLSQNINLHIYAKGFDAKSSYKHLWSEVAPLWRGESDLTIANFEGTCTPITGQIPRKSLSKITKANYRSVYTSSVSAGGFNYPPALAEGMYDDAKIDVITLGHNHIFDRGIPGVGVTKRTLEDIGLVTVGVMDPSEASSDEVDTRNVPERWYQIVRRKGWKLALLSCCNFDFGQNWAPYILHCKDILRIVKGHIRPNHPDLDAIIVLPHWGTEFVAQTTPRQAQLADQWAKAGISLVLGNHPHLAQRATAVYNENKEMTTFTVFSLGGLFGGLGQRSKEVIRPRASAVIYTKLSKNENDETIVDASFAPICEEFETNMPARALKVRPIPTYTTKRCNDEERIIKGLFQPAARQRSPEEVMAAIEASKL